VGARHVLTDKQISAAKAAPSKRRYILWDAVTPSLGLRVTDKAHKSFIVQRRVNGRQVMMTLGEYPALPLADAREKAQDTLKSMTKGLDPRQVKQAPVSASGLRRDSFEGAVETYIKREVEKNRRPRTQDEIIRPLRKVLVPRWGSLSVRDIGPREIIDLLDEIVDAGTPVAANRTYSVLHRFFRWCVERHLIDANPAANIRKPAKEESRSRALDDNELRDVWLAAESLGWPFGSVFQGLILTGQRRNELAGMTWDELDLGSLTWTIQPTHTKNNKEHVVPIAPLLLEIINKAPQFVAVGLAPGDRPPTSGQDPGRLPVFTTTGRTPVSGYSRAKTTLDARVLENRRKAAQGLGKDPSKARPLPSWTLHDLRRSCATGMARIGVQPHIIEMVLNHSGGFRSGVAGVYQRHPYLEEKRRALDAWSSHIAALIAPEHADKNILKFRKGEP